MIYNNQWNIIWKIQTFWFTCGEMRLSTQRFITSLHSDGLSIACRMSKRNTGVHVSCIGSYFGKPSRLVPLAIGLKIPTSIQSFINQAQQLYTLCSKESRSPQFSISVVGVQNWPESFPFAMRLVATNLMVLWEAPDDLTLATKQALQKMNMMIYITTMATDQTLRNRCNKSHL
jgi:hypothetical protein